MVRSTSSPVALHCCSPTTSVPHCLFSSSYATPGVPLSKSASHPFQPWDVPCLQQALHLTNYRTVLWCTWMGTMKHKDQSPSPCLVHWECLNPKQKGAGITPSHHTSPAPLSHYWIRRDGFTSWADPIGLVTFLFPQEPDGSLCVTANASQLASRVKDIVLIWGWQ